MLMTDCDRKHITDGEVRLKCIFIVLIIDISIYLCIETHAKHDRMAHVHHGHHLVPSLHHGQIQYGRSGCKQGASLYLAASEAREASCSKGIKGNRNFPPIFTRDAYTQAARWLIPRLFPERRFSDCA